MDQRSNRFSTKEILSVVLVSLLTISILFTAQLMTPISIIWPYATITFLFPIPLMHYIYYKDHNRFNSLIGRIIQDTALVIILCLLLFTFLHLNDIFYKIGSFPNLITFVTLWVVMCEILFSVFCSIVCVIRKK